MVSRPAGARRKQQKSPARKRRIDSLDLSKLTIRQAKYRKNRLKGMSIYMAAIEAGYSHNYASGNASRLLEKRVKKSIFDALELVGADNINCAKELQRIAFKSTKVEKCQVYQEDEEGNVEVIEEGTRVPDDMARLKALDQIGRLKKQIAAPFEKIPDNVDFTRLVIVVENDPNKKKVSDGQLSGRENIPNVEAESRVVVSD